MIEYAALTSVFFPGDVNARLLVEPPGSLGFQFRGEPRSLKHSYLGPFRRGQIVLGSQMLNRPEVRNAIALGREIAANGPLAVLAAKQAIVESRDWPLDEQFARQQAICGPVRVSEDAREGALVFTEKRAPVRRGR